MRAILVIIGLAAVVLVALMALGLVRVEQTSTGSLPTIALSGGKAPTFKADVGKVNVGTTDKTVQVPTVAMTNATVRVPTVNVEKADNSAAPAK